MTDRQRWRERRRCDTTTRQRPTAMPRKRRRTRGGARGTDAAGARRMIRSPWFRSGSISALLILASFLLDGCILLAGDGGSAPRDLRGEAGGIGLPTDVGRDSSVEAGPVGGRGSGARCGVNGQNQCGPFMICDVDEGCVECATDEQCPRSAPICVSGSCVSCRSAPSDGGADAPPCPNDSPACWPRDHQCHARCTSAAECPSEAHICDLASGQCWGCRGDADCPSGVCSARTKQCAACRDDHDCPSTLPRCRLLRGTCEQCTSNNDCGLAAPICDPATFRCRVGCVSDAQCPNQRCDIAGAVCVPLASAILDAGAG